MKEYLKKLIDNDIIRIKNDINRMEQRYGGAAATDSQGLEKQIQLKEDELRRVSLYREKLDDIDFKNL